MKGRAEAGIPCHPGAHHSHGRRGGPSRSEALHRLSLAIDRQLAEAEPDNTVYQRDLSISYERLADLAHAAQQGAEAREWLGQAVARRRSLHEQEPLRIDLAEELAYCLYLIASVDETNIDEMEQEMITLLTPFERSGTITRRAASMLTWARE